MILESSNNQPLMRDDALVPNARHAGAEAQREEGPGPQVANKRRNDAEARQGAALPIRWVTE